MSFYSVANSTPNFVINNSAAASQARNNIVAPWAVASHYPKTISLGASSLTLDPQETISGAFYVQPATATPITVTLPDSASWYRFLATRSIPGYDNISDNDMFMFNVVLAGTGTTVNFAPGTGGVGLTHSFSKPLTGAGATGAQCNCLPVQWRVTSTGTWYNVL